jgi:hypothetical protein
MRFRDVPPDGAVLVLLSEMTGRLHDLGVPGAEEKVRQAAVTARTDPSAAAILVAEAAALVRAQNQRPRSD